MVGTRPRIRDLGYSPGRFRPGPKNSLLDVKGVTVGQITIHKDPDVHTGLTLIFPRGMHGTRQHPCYAASHDLNGMGELRDRMGLQSGGIQIVQ